MLPESLQAELKADEPLQGWATLEKRTAMAQLILDTKPMIVVEIGVFGGKSLIPQAQALRVNGDQGVIVGIDPWRLPEVLEGDLSDADRKWWRENVDLHEIHSDFMEAVWERKLENWAVVMRCSSRQASGFFNREPIDILHIDGNHTELASCRDVELYLPLMKPKGYIWFDDADWQTTQKAIAILREKCNEVSKVGACILFQLK